MIKTSLPYTGQLLNRNVIALVFIGVPLFVVITCLAYYFGSATMGWDWYGAFRPDALHLIAGKTPYYDGDFFNAPWILLPLVPIALLPERLSCAVIYTLNIYAFAFIAWKLGMKPWMALAYAFSPLVMHAGNVGQIDFMAALGLVMPPQIGLFFILAKPQTTGMVAVFWLVEAWRVGGIRRVFVTFAPVSLAFLLSFALYGFWPAAAPDLTGAFWNRTLWPLSILPGVVMLGLSILTRRKELAVGASPMLSPYVGGASWVAFPLSFLPDHRKTFFAVLIGWLLFSWVIS